MATCTKKDVEKYRELLLEVGVAVELPNATASETICKKLTDRSTTNPHLAEELQNLLDHAFFHSDKTYLFVIPPDKQVSLQVSSALFAEAMRSSGKTRGIFHDAMFELHRAHSNRFKGESDVPLGGTMRVASYLPEEGFDPKPPIKFPLSYFEYTVGDDGEKGVLRKGDSITSISNGIVHAFEHEGSLYAVTGLVSGFQKGGKRYYSSASVHRLVPRSEWKKKVFKKQDELYRLWDQKKVLRGVMDGLAVKLKGSPYVIAESLYAIPDVPELAW